jgi:lipopolysaccharide biosynthesis glycosyltransferase
MSEPAKTLIYFCVFFQKQYVDLLQSLLCSCKIFANVSQYDFLVLTSTELLENVQRLETLIGIPLRIHCMQANDKFSSAAAKCRIYEVPDIERYETILYLDADIIIQNDFSKMLENIQSDMLYGVDDGNLEHPGNGGWFWKKNECSNPKSVRSINSGVLLFRNTPKIREIMTDCVKFMFARKESNQPMPCCLEQPFINYFFYKARCMNSQYLKQFVFLHKKNDPTNKDDICILHFLAPVGSTAGKLHRMNTYFTKILKTYTQSETNKTFSNKYAWNSDYIHFKSNKTLLTAWGFSGTYKVLDANTIVATFGRRDHWIRFYEGETSFLSVRHGDCVVMNCKKI